jgi:hypothetical protein
MIDPLTLSFMVVVVLAAITLTPFIADLIRCIEEVIRG